MERLGYAYDPRVLRHRTGDVRVTLPDGSAQVLAPHPSTHWITEAIDALVRSSSLAPALLPIATRAASADELALAHDPAYVARVAALSAAGGGDAGDVAPVGPSSYEAAALSAGGAVAAVDALLDGTVARAYVLARPPGHHATRDLGMGYCLFNNVAIAALHARRRGVARVAIVDWDVHHGNGTQAIFYRDPAVLLISLHQQRWYPRQGGSLDEKGEGPGRGATINVPLPPGTGDRGYAEALSSIVAPALRRFRPELLLVSAGQDASLHDPLGRMLLSAAGYRSLGTTVRALADELCGGKLVAIQEGGYSPDYTALCTLAALEGITGLASGIADPYLESSEHQEAASTYSDETRDALACAREAHAEHL